MTVLAEEVGQGVTVLRMDRPDKRNAIDMAMIDGIRDGITGAPGAAVVLASSDPRAFSAGADLSLADADRAAVSDALYGLYDAMRSSPAVIVAAASGFAVGGGAQLLLGCDIRFGAPDLRIRFLGPGHGLAVGAWGLPSLVGRGRAMELCLSMRPVDADEAHAIGLLTRIEADPVTAAIEFATAVTALDRGAVTAIKRIMFTADPGEALAMERAFNSEWDGNVDRAGR